MDERGQVVPFVALLLVLTAGAALMVGRLGGAAADRARAVTAADAAALAGAGRGGKVAAETLAVANGGRLLGFTSSAHEVRVIVAVGGATATARARAGRLGPLPRRAPGVAAPGPLDMVALPPGRARGLTPSMERALADAAARLGEPVPVTSGFRSRAAQQRLYDHRDTNPYPVAVPGTSMHERGLAVDVPVWFVARLASVARQVGLCQPYPGADPVHFELCAGH